MGVCGSKDKPSNNDNRQPPSAAQASSKPTFQAPSNNTPAPLKVVASSSNPVGNYRPDHVDSSSFVAGPRVEQPVKTGWSPISHLNTMEARLSNRWAQLKRSGNLDDIRQLTYADSRPLQGPYTSDSNPRVSFLGQFNVNNQPDGFGTMVIGNTEYYEGNFKNGIRSGYGAVVRNDESFYVGYWENGKFHGKGRYLWSSGLIIEGGWKEDVPNGTINITANGGKKVFKLVQDTSDQCLGTLVHNNTQYQVHGQIRMNKIDLQVDLGNNHFEKEVFTNGINV